MIEYETGDIEIVLADIRKNLPSKIYKYRVWEDDYHKTMLTENKAWFSHPKKLNDPYDIRTKIRFDLPELDNPLFFEKLKEVLKEEVPFPVDSYEFRTFCRNYFNKIKANPEKHFQENYL